MSSSSGIGTLIVSLIATVVILYLCYLLSRFLSKKVNNASTSNNMKIIERLALTQDKGLVIVEICQKLYLVGFANNGVEILQELDESDLCSSQSALKQGFSNVFHLQSKTAWNLKAIKNDLPESADLYEKLYLVGYVNNDIAVLKEFDKPVLGSSKSLFKKGFFDNFRSTLKHRWDLKVNGKGTKQDEDDKTTEETEE